MPNIDRRTLNGKLTPDQWEAIVALINSLPVGAKVDRRAICERYGISRQALSKRLAKLEKN